METSGQEETYIANVGSKREERMWNEVSQIESVLNDLELKQNEIKHIQLSSNSIGLEVAKALANKISLLKKLNHADFHDIFVSRLKDELPSSLRYLIESIQDKNILILNLSDNAFGPSGVAAFDFYLRSTTTLKELYIENCGLGPEGGESVAKALESNSNLLLERIRVGRNRLENKGATAFGNYFASTNSLVEVQAFQNGIKDQGISSFLRGLISNKSLKILKVNDNLITDAVDALIELISSLPILEVLDISDSNLGSEKALRIFKVLAKSSTIKEIYCNYNDIEDKTYQGEIVDTLLTLDHKLTKLEIKGNEIKKNIFKKIKTSELLREADVYSESEMDGDELEELLSSLSLK